MPNDEEGEGDVMMQSNHHPPDEILEHSVILILSHAVVYMQVDMCLFQAMLLKEVMEQTDDCVGPLPCVTGFINEVVDLPRDSFTTYPKESALARSEEVDGAWLARV